MGLEQRAPASPDEDAHHVDPAHASHSSRPGNHRAALSTGLIDVTTRGPAVRHSKESASQSRGVEADDQIQFTVRERLRCRDTGGS